MGISLLHTYEHGRYNVKFFPYYDLFYLFVVCIYVSYAPDHIQSHKHNRQDSSGWGIIPLHRLIWQNTTFIRDIHASADIRTHNPRRRTASNLSFRQPGHPIRLIWNLIPEVYAYRISVWDQYTENWKVSRFVFCGRGYLTLIGLIWNKII